MGDQTEIEGEAQILADYGTTGRRPQAEIAAVVLSIHKAKLVALSVQKAQLEALTDLGPQSMGNIGHGAGSMALPS